jgi:hypothetical protein
LSLKLVIRFFMDNLRDHLLQHLVSEPASRPSFTDNELFPVTIDKKRLYTLSCAIAMLSISKAQGTPFLFIVPAQRVSNTRVLRVFHADVLATPTGQKKCVEFLWVKWFETDNSVAFGARALRLKRVQYLPEDTRFGYGLINPSHVIRAVQIQPAVRHCMAPRPHGRSLAHDTPSGNYKYYYVGQ